MSPKASNDPELSLLGPVLELTVIVAQASERANPPIPAPTALRPFLNFNRRVPPAALRAARRVLDEDQAFRSRVAIAATEELVGRAGFLYASRPEGWEDEFQALLESAAETSNAAKGPGSGSGDAGARQLERRLRGAEEALRRTEAAAVKTEEALVRLRTELAAAQEHLRTERAARQEAEAALASAQARAQRGFEERDEARAQLVRSFATIDELRRCLAEREDRLAHLESEAERRERFDASVARAMGALDDVRAAMAATLDGGVGVAGGAGPRQAPGGPAARTPGSVEGEDEDSVSGFVSVVRRPTPSRAERSRALAEQRTAGRRVAAQLPFAVLEESVEAAQHLLRLPSVLVLVDGYNVSKYRWGELDPASQRQRLVDLLGELQARTGAEVRVVFDGAEVSGPPSVPAVGRRPVRVVFSPPEVEADDVLIDLVASLPIGRPVVVVSSDRRVQDGVRRGGANVVSTPQFLSAL